MIQLSYRRGPGAQAGALLVALFIVFSAVPTDAQQRDDTIRRPRVVASTSWTGAIAQAAGAEVVRILAPVELRHPPEYDFRPGDIRHAVEADYIVWAGYEVFMRNLYQAAEIEAERVLLVSTNNTPPLLKNVVRELAETFGTLEHFAAWEQELDEMAARLIEGAQRRNASEVRAVVHVHLLVLAEWLGFQIVDQIGMAELSPGRLREILAKNPDLVIDNWHNPTGEPLRGQVNEYVTWINFPGRDGTRTVIDVLRQNGSLLGLVE